VEAPVLVGGLTWLAGPGGSGTGCASWTDGVSRGSDLPLKTAELGLGGVGPPWRGVRMSSAGASPSRCTRTMLLPVPSSRADKI
jgi:hypothetical protein